jgi:GH15 family glucan-1,4-alpha-glucosidase
MTTRIHDLALIGNANTAALINGNGEIVWACLPRPDADPMFCSLLKPRGGDDDFGYACVDLVDFARSEQRYIPNTAILRTRLHDAHGGTIEITDFAPRFNQFGRMFCPAMLVRSVRRIAGAPRIQVRVRPAVEYGARRPRTTFGSNHVRYIGTDFVLRITTDCSVTALMEETPFYLSETLSFIMGPDETVQHSAHEVVRHFHDQTLVYWRDWIRTLGVPFEWQEEIIRAAITIKLNAYDDTGAIIAAVTTSIPESADSGRNWDYRYCWLRDAYFVVGALNRLSATQTMERYLGYIMNIASANPDFNLQPVYRINGHADIEEREVPSLAGYRGMGPVRVGNQAYRQVQNDVYGSAILAATHMFFDARLSAPGDHALFQHLEKIGEQAVRAYALPDAGPWEVRGWTSVHTFSSMMCWVACDRLARISRRLGLAERHRHWSAHADRIKSEICERAWNERRQSFVGTFDGDALDASVLLMNELGFVEADDPRFVRTVSAIEHELKQGDFVYRYSTPDDFGVPHNAFVVCTFWYIDALAAIGRRDEARELYTKMLACRNAHGLLSEHIDPRTHELWGNFPQTFSMVGLITSGVRLSIPWDKAC